MEQPRLIAQIAARRRCATLRLSLVGRRIGGPLWLHDPFAEAIRFLKGSIAQKHHLDAAEATASSCGVDHAWLPRAAEGEAWWARQDSNLQPDRYERPALTIELQAPATCRSTGNAVAPDPYNANEAGAMRRTISDFQKLT
jgi:hypothetical protein